MVMITKTQQPHIHWQFFFLNNLQKCSKWACKHRSSVIYHSESMFWFQSHFGVKVRGETEVGRPDERDRVNWLAQVLCFTTLHHRQISVTVLCPKTWWPKHLGWFWLERCWQGWEGTAGVAGYLSNGPNLEWLSHMNCTTEYIAASV